MSSNPQPLGEVYVHMRDAEVDSAECLHSCVTMFRDGAGGAVGFEIVGAARVEIDGRETRAVPPLLENPLGQHEIDVVHDLALGMTVRQIAKKYRVAQSTISMRLSRLSLRMGTHTSTQTVVECLARGWVRLERPAEVHGA